MKPVRTAASDGPLGVTFKLEGETEENDLPTESIYANGRPSFESLWEPTEEELARLNESGLVRLRVWGDGHPPVSLGVEGGE